MRVTGRVLIVLCVLMLLAAAIPASADDSYDLEHDGFSTSYTYNYDYWGDAQASPDAYRVDAVIDATTLGMDALGGKRLNKPQSLFVRDNDIYIVDSGNNRILQVEYRDNNYQLTRIIDHVTGGSPETFKTPYDVFVDTEDNIYVADYGNYRVVMMDKDLNLLKVFTKPTDSTFDQKLDFLPKKITLRHRHQREQGPGEVRGRHDVYRLHRCHAGQRVHGGVYLETLFPDQGTAGGFRVLRSHRV